MKYFGGIWCAVLLLWIYWVLLIPQYSVRDIGAPCRDHGGVRQYAPHSFPWNDQPIVVCRDGKVGEVNQNTK